MTNKKCPTCHGSGLTESNDETDLTITGTCNKCKGLGFIPMTEMKRISQGEQFNCSLISKCPYRLVKDVITETCNVQLSADQQVLESYKSEQEKKYKTLLEISQHNEKSYEAAIKRLEAEIAQLKDEKKNMIEEVKGIGTNYWWQSFKTKHTEGK